MNEPEIIDAIQSQDRVHIGGGGTRGGGDFAVADAGIVTYSPDELLITLNAGTTMAELEAALDAKGQMLAQEPMDHRVILGTSGEPTIGGAIGVNADGPRRLRFGALREAVLGLRFIDGRGESLRAGGIVMKNVTGLDITKFFVGSRGALGVATQASLKLLPKTPERQYRAFEIPMDEAMRAVLPLLRAPLEITGAVYAGGHLHIRQEGELLKPLTQQLEDALGKGQEQSAQTWIDLRDWVPMKDHAELWRIFTRPTLASETLRALDAEAMVLCGGAQLLVSADETAICAALKAGQFAICEKGAARGKRLPKAHLGEAEIRAKLTAVFDPENKFRGSNEN